MDTGKLNVGSLLSFASVEDTQDELVAPKPQTPKKRGRPKKKANLATDILSLHIGTNSEVERRCAHIEPQVISQLANVSQLLEAKAPLLPAELIDVYDLQTKQRPLLYLIGTKSETGGTYTYLYGSAAASHKGMGWYEIPKTGKLFKVKDTAHLTEQSDTFNLLSSADIAKKMQNDEMIRGLVSGIISAHQSLLTSKYGVETIMGGEDGSDVKAFVRITSLGTLGLTDLSYISSSKVVVSIMDIEPLVRTWALTNGVAWDDFRDRVVMLNSDRAGLPIRNLDDNELRTLHSELSTRYRVPFPSSSLENLVMKIARENMINTFTTEMNDIEQRAASGTLEFVDHRNIADRYLKVLGTPEQREALNAALALWFEAFVARAIYPGCYFRNIPVFVGDQNLGKSRWAIIIAGNKDHVAEIAGLSSGGNSHNSINSNELKMLKATHSIMLIDEIDGSIKGSESSDMKKFIEADTVLYRPIYGRQHIRKNQYATLFGATNNTNILKDTTGNSRYWIFPLGITKGDPLDQDLLQSERDGILASALASLRAKVAEDPVAMEKLQLPYQQAQALEKCNKDNLVSSPMEAFVEPFIYVTDESDSGEHVERKLQYIHANSVMNILTDKASGKVSWNDAEVIMNKLGYDLLSRVSISGRPQQKVFSLRDSEGHTVKANKTHPDFIELINAQKNTTRSNDY